MSEEISDELREAVERLAALPPPPAYLVGSPAEAAERLARLVLDAYVEGRIDGVMRELARRVLGEE